MSTPRCTICDCERVPLDRENSSFGACTNIECRDPLYDYRSENPYKSVPKPTEGVAAPLEPTQIAARNFRIDRSINDGTMMSGNWIDAIMAEFAAAVSKNLQRYENAITNHLCEYDAADWLACRGCHTKGDGKVYCVVCEENGDHAHKERDVLQASVDQLCGDLKAIQKDYTNEKKRAENLQQERDQFSKMAHNLRKIAEEKTLLVHKVGGKLDKRDNRISELEKEIAALRETK